MVELSWWMGTRVGMEKYKSKKVAEKKQKRVQGGVGRGEVYKPTFHCNFSYTTSKIKDGET